MTAATRNGNKAPLRKIQANESTGTGGVNRVASVPDAFIANKYKGRKFGEHTDFEIFDLAMANHWNVLMEGDTGTGKTIAARAYAASREVCFYSTPSNVGIDPTQLMGKFIPDPSGDALGIWQDGPVTDMVRHGGVLLINEINFLPARVATALFSLLDGRREIALLDHKGEVIRAHNDLLIIADMNPDYLGTVTLNAALRNRFEIQLHWDYDAGVERELVAGATLRGFANNMRMMMRDGDINTPTSTNMLQEFEQIAKTLGVDFACQNLVQHYSADDRKAVQEALRAQKNNIERDYKPKPPPSPAAAAAKRIANSRNDNFVFGEGNEEMINWMNSEGGD